MVKGELRNKVEKIGLKDEFSHLLEEARTVMPGIQALFGFQLIVVFSDKFSERLSRSEQTWHLVATALTALAAGLAVTPAALHRQSCPDLISTKLTKLATYSLAAALLPLALAVSIDLWLLGQMILGDGDQAKTLAGAILVLFLGLWYVGPMLLKAKINRAS